MGGNYFLLEFISFSQFYPLFIHLAIFEYLIIKVVVCKPNFEEAIFSIYVTPSPPEDLEFVTNLDKIGYFGKEVCITILALLSMFSWWYSMDCS